MMNWQHICDEAAKLARLVEGWAAADGISAIERDLALAKLRALYDAIRFADPTSGTAAGPETPETAPESINLDEVLAAGPAIVSAASEPAAEPSAAGSAEAMPAASGAGRFAGEPAEETPEGGDVAASGPEPEHPAQEPSESGRAALGMESLFELESLTRKQRKRQVIMSLYGAGGPVVAGRTQPAATDRPAEAHAAASEVSEETLPERTGGPAMSGAGMVAVTGDDSGDPVADLAIPEEDGAAEREIAVEDDAGVGEPAEEPVAAAEELVAAAEEPVAAAEEPVAEMSGTSAACGTAPAEEPGRSGEPRPDVSPEGTSEPLPVPVPEVASAPAAGTTEEDASEPVAGSVVLSEEPAPAAEPVPQPGATPGSGLSSAPEAADGAGSAPVAAAAGHAAVDSVVAEAAPVLGEVINHDVRTLADTFASRRDTASELARGGAVADLRQAIGINDRFLLIRDLFGGDAGEYDRVIDLLNGFDDLDECMIHITEHYAWNPNSDGAKFLVELLERKLS